MSRTVRCKNQKPNEFRLTSREEYERMRNLDWPKWYRCGWRSLVKDTFEKTRKAELKKAHSEHGLKYFFRSSPPAGFRRDWNAKWKCKEKMILRKSVREDCGENYIVLRPGNCKDIWWAWD